MYYTFKRKGKPARGFFQVFLKRGFPKLRGLRACQFMTMEKMFMILEYNSWGLKGFAK